MKVALWILISMLTACSYQGISSHELDTTQSKGNPQKGYQTQTLNIKCSSCRSVQVFDGFSTSAANKDMLLWILTMPASQISPVIIASAKGHQPSLKIIQDFTHTQHISLKPEKAMKNIGYLTGIVANTSTGPKALGISKTYTHKKIIITRGRAMKTTFTNNHGLFQIPLDAGSYRVMVQGRQYTVDIHLGETTFLPIILGQMIIN